MDRLGRGHELNVHYTLHGGDAAGVSGMRKAHGKNCVDHGPRSPPVGDQVVS